MEYMTLRNGNKMPMEGFGVYQVSDLEECRRVVYHAIKAGYRLIDTAALYMNEEAVGQAIKDAINDGIVTREELFIVTKVWIKDYPYEAAKKSINISLEKLGLDYVDAFLIHQPYGDVYGAWRAIVEEHEAGRLKAIGVSNFGIAKFVEFCELVDVKPMINQMEMHPFHGQYDLIEIMKSYGCMPMAWAPLAEGKFDIFTNPVLTEIGKKYNKSAAQIALKWNAQRGVSIIPKSVHEERIDQNIDIWDFALTDEEMKQVDALDRKDAGLVDHTRIPVIKFIVHSKDRY